MMSILYILLCLLPLLAKGQSTIGCFVSGECYNGVSGIITSQPDANACLEDCKNDEACLYFTFDTVIDACVHQSACGGLVDAHLTTLFTGHATCDPLECGNLGHCDGAAINVLLADSIDECFNVCAVDAGCNWWTYSYGGDNFCATYTDCPRVDTTCNYCLHGQRACENVTRCADDWEPYPGSSHCVQVFPTARVYGDAQSTCQNAGPNGNLVSIHSQFQQDFIVDLLVANGIENSWIGLNDLIVEGDFKWLDGTEVDYTNWFDGQPDNGATLGEDGVHLWLGNDWKWNDAICSIAAKCR